MNIDMSTVIEGVTLTKVCSVKPDGDSDDSKQVTVNMKYDGLTLQDVFTKALKSDVISWQQGARKRFDTLEKVANVSASKPGGQPQVDPKQALINEATAAGVDVKDKKAFSEWLSERFDI